MSRKTKIAGIWITIIAGICALLTAMTQITTDYQKTKSKVEFHDKAFEQNSKEHDEIKTEVIQNRGYLIQIIEKM